MSVNPFLYPYRRLVLVLMLLPVCALAENYTLGERHYRQALDETDLANRLKLLEHAIKANPESFESWYMKGRTLIVLKRLDDAAQAFKKASAIAYNDRGVGLALGRLAEVRDLQAQLHLAHHLIRNALRKFSSDSPAPEWLQDLAQEIESESADTIVSAEDIRRSLADATRFATIPRVDLWVHFDFEKATLSMKGEHQAEELAKALHGLLTATDAQSRPYRYLIIGHTDKRGSTCFNHQLSLQRAMTVRNKVQARFAELAAQLCVLGKGESALLKQGNSEHDHRLNRRVEVQLVDQCPPDPGC